MLNFIPKALLGAGMAALTAGFITVSEWDLTDAASAILHAGTVAPNVAALRQVPSVGAVVIDSRLVNPNSSLGNDLISLDIYAERNAAGVASLRRALASNPVTRSALEANHLNIGKIVGVQIGSTGSLRVYTN